MALPAEVSDSTSKSDKILEDLPNICLLLFLYVLQGIPLGLASAVPFILQSSTNINNYQLQATFSLVFWPFSLKLIWAPIIDSIYNSYIGRRKSWLIPTQYAIGIDLLVLARYINQWLGRESNNPWGELGKEGPVDIIRLTAAFFGLTFLAATQDIVVDGWALTMLSKKNLGWSSTCNTVGQALGYVIAFILFLCLESPEISNTYLRRTPIEGQGLISFSGFLYFWGISFLISTTVVGLFKNEKDSKLTEKLLQFLTYCFKFKSINQFHSLGQSRSFLLRSSNNTSDSNAQIPIDNSIEMVAQTNLVNNDQPIILNSQNSNEQDNEFIVFERNQLKNISNTTENNNNHNVQLIIDSNQFKDQTSDTKLLTEELSLLDTYKIMLGVIRLKPIWQYISILFVVRACIAASDSIFSLKLIENGFSKERLAFFGLILLPLHTIIPLLITHWTNGPKPLGVYSTLILPRLIVSSFVIPIVYYAPHFRTLKQPMNNTDLFDHNFMNLTHSLLSNRTTIYIPSTILSATPQPPTPLQLTTTPATTQITSTIHTITNSLNTHGIIRDRGTKYTFSWSFYVILMTQLCSHTIITTIITVSQMAFHARISDPTVGGTYMTLLNTASNLASSLPSTVFLSLVEPFTIRTCMGINPLEIGLASTEKTPKISRDLAKHLLSEDELIERGKLWLKYNATCKLPDGSKACEDVGGHCVVKLDGFYLEVGISLFIGLITFPFLVHPLTKRLDSLPSSEFSYKLDHDKHYCDCKCNCKKSPKTIPEEFTEYSTVTI